MKLPDQLRHALPDGRDDRGCRIASSRGAVVGGAGPEAMSKSVFEKVDSPA